MEQHKLHLHIPLIGNLHLSEPYRE